MHYFISEYYAEIWYNSFMTTLMEQLQHKTNFTANEIVIADYIISHPDDVVEISVQKLAKLTYTSTSAVMRLCARLNLSGFKEFKLQFAREINQSSTENYDVDPNFPFHKNDSLRTVASQLRKLTVNTLSEAEKTFSYDDMYRACMIMQNARHVALFGIGDAYLSGLTFQARMMRISTHILATPVYGEQHHLSETLKKGDCGLLLSYSGVTSYTLDCARELKKNSVTTICITAGENSPLAKMCDIALILPAKEDKFHRIASFFSQACMDYYLNIIYSYLYVLNYDKHIEDLNKNA